jgi:eukaryotic-like serine/threonine-protein kinase
MGAVRVMALQLGTRLGAYEITSLIGAGGMGEVYRARDTRLGRDVAIKVLPSQFALDSERVGRFTREAQVLASLNHPNIAAIYGFEESGALVLEYVDGPTLADLISRRAGPSGPAGLPLDEALPIARQIADALEAAHEQQIVHRDLKPANVKVRSDGTVKVLDFGLAKLVPGPAEAGHYGGSTGAGHHDAANLSVSPTITTPAMTMAGVILGTAAYMSPEQAKGRPADKRSDIWAFGCVLFEMLTGKRPFDGDDVSDTLAAVLRAEPDWSAIPDATPRAVRTLLRRCLEKDRRRRLADAADARLELDDAVTERPEASWSPATPTQPSLARSAMPLAIGIGLAIALTSAVWWSLRPRSETPIVTRFTIPLADDELMASYPFRAIAISPDGRQIVWASNLRLNIRSMGSLTPTAIAGTDHGFAIGSPAFSPDGKSIVYSTLGDRGAGAVLRTISTTGGVPTVVAQAGGNGGVSGLSWSEGGILYTDNSGIVRVSPSGGKPETVVPLAQGETMQGATALPGGAGILFAVAKGREPGIAPTIDLWDGATIVVQPPTGQRKTLITGGSDPHYLPTGHLLYARGGTLFVAPFDLKRLTVAGNGMPVMEGVARAILGRTSTGVAQADVSANGSIVYAPGPASPASEPTRLVIVDRAGNVTPLKVQTGFYERPRVSPDGTQLALGSEDSSGATIWIHDLSRDTSMRPLTFQGDGRNRFPVWSPDGTYVAFQSDREGDPAIFRQRSDGSSKAERLTTPDKGTAHVPETWSRDGKHLAYSVVKTTSNTLWVYSLDSKNSIQVPDVDTPRLLSPSFSPDGRWIAYTVTTSNGQNQVLVQPFPPNGPKQLVGPGARPLWSRSGKEIFYYRGDSTFFKTVIANQPGLTLSNETALSFNVFLGRGPGPGRDADIMPDDKRFVAVVVPSGTSSGAVGIRRFDVIANWFEELKQRVPNN